jgi:hypothetical protein
MNKEKREGRVILLLSNLLPRALLDLTIDQMRHPREEAGRGAKATKGAESEVRRSIDLD